MKLTDIGMVDLCQKPYFRRRHGVLLRQKEFEFEDSACERHRNTEQVKVSTRRYRIITRRSLRAVFLEGSRGDVIRKYDVPSNGLPLGPAIVTSKYRRLSACGAALIPGAGSLARRSVS